MSEPFDFNKALAALQNGQDLTGKDGIFTPLVKQLVYYRDLTPRINPSFEYTIVRTTVSAIDFHPDHWLTSSDASSWFQY